MNKFNLLTVAIIGTLLTACGGGDGSPKKPDICKELNQEKCNEIVIPESSSSASSEYVEVVPSNNLLPISENFNVSNTTEFFSPAYKSLVTINPEDPSNSLFYATSGLSEGRIAVENGKLTIGNARFTIGQTLDTTGTHIDPTKTYSDYKVGTTAASNAIFPMLDSWGDLDLRNNWKVSFCVVEREALAGSVGNQSFYVMLDNNHSTAEADKSIHGARSIVFQAPVSSFEVGKRVEINIPGNATSNGSLIGTSSRIGLEKSFLQFRVPSAGVVTMSELWIGYQSNTSTEPTNATCAAGQRVSSYLKPLPPVAPLEITFLPGSGQLRATWTASARATSYSVAYGLTEDFSAATIVENAQASTVENQVSYTISGLENGTTYYVWVRAANATGASEWSLPFTGVPEVPTVAPEVVEGFKVYVDDSRVFLTWSINDAATSYKVFQNTTNIFTGATELATVTDNFYRIKSLVNNTPYYFFITAVNGAGSSEAVTVAATPKTPAPNIYQADFTVAREQFFDSAASTGFATTPAVQTISLDNDQAMALAMAGESRMMMTENGLRVANARFSIGLAGVQQEDGSYTYTASAANVAPVGGTFDLTNNYQICYTVAEKHTAGLFRVYVDNTSTTSGNSIHGATSRLINQSITDIPLNAEQCVDFVDSNHRGTANSFFLLNTDGASGEVGVVLSSFKVVDLGAVPVKDTAGSSASSSAPASSAASVSSSTVVSSSAPTSSASPASSSSLSSSAVQLSTSSSSSSSTPASSSSFSSSDAPTSSSSFSSSNAPTSSSSISSAISGGVSSIASSTASSAASSSAALLSEDFASATTDNFFTNTYKAISTDSSLPLYVATSGSTRISFANGELSMNNARFTIGDKGGATTASTQPNGSFDLRTPYRIKFTITAATGTGNIQVYVDNNTTGAGNSIHSSIGSTASRLIQLAVTDITNLPYELVVESDVGTATSFFQIRADSNVSNLTIDNVQIEYQ